MTRHIGFSIVAAVTTTYVAFIANGACARVRHIRPAHHPAAALLPSHRRDLSLARMDLGPRGVLNRPYGHMFAAPRADTLPGSVSRQMVPDGPVGSLGLVRFAGSNALQTGALGNDIASRASLPSQRVGVNLSYDFR